MWDSIISFLECDNFLVQYYSVLGGIAVFVYVVYILFFRKKRRFGENR